MDQLASSMGHASVVAAGYGAETFVPVGSRLMHDYPLEICSRVHTSLRYCTHLSNCQRVEKMRAKGYVEPVFRVPIPSINLYPSLGVILKFVCGYRSDAPPRTRRQG